ncbi:MAG: iron-sulfur cluster assembly scaffold protein [Candidatus Babeliales bacterium]|jgi:nitrogen fixation NifU-like protein
MYKEELMDHYRYPRNKQSLDHPDFSYDDNNPSCGDSIRIEGTIDHKKVTALGFSGSGCVISQATASMLTQACVGKTIDEIMALTKDDILAMIELQLGPTRLKCALISLHALQQGLMLYQQKNNPMKGKNE